MSYMEQQMQQVMEASEHEYNELMEEFKPPHDWDRPEWEARQKVHNWRNYASEGIKREWQSFAGRQKIMIASLLDGLADKEHWD